MVSGFGKFQVNEKKSNGATGEDMMLDGRRVMTFWCSGKLRGEDQISKTIVTLFY